MKLKSAAALGLGIAMIGGTLKADDAKAPAWYENTSVHGYVDAYYQYNFNGLAPVGRAFDSTEQQFTVNGAKLSIMNADKASGTSGEVDLLYGPMASVYNSGNWGSLTTVTGSASAISSLAVEQAFLTQAMGPVTFKLGKFGTFVGNEVTDASGDMNYSRSFLFGQEPFYNVGLSATYGVMDGLSLMGYMGDGNSVDNGPANHPDFGAQVAYTGVKNLSLIGTYYDQPTGPINYATNATPPVGITAWTNINMFNFVGSYQAMDNLAFAGEYLYKDQAVPSEAFNYYSSSIDSQGYALYADYQTPVAGLKIDPRYEQWFNSSYQVVNSTWTGTNSTFQSQYDDFTLTLKYAKGPLTQYLEFRDDASTTTSFSAGADLSKLPVTTQNTLTYAAVYSF